MNAVRLCLMAACALAGATLLAPAPAAAQAGETPWYMPQPWMSPQNTAPKVASRPGYYGHAKHSQIAYGGFSNGCYGACGHRVGTVVTGSGLVLFRPKVVIYDPRAFSVVPRGTILVTQGHFIIRENPAAQRQKAIAALPKDFLDRHPSLLNAQRPAFQRKSMPLISHQNGVKLIRPNTSY